MAPDPFFTFSFQVVSVAEGFAKINGADLKLFYVISANNIPSVFAGNIGNNALLSVTLGSKKYLPVFVGKAEAEVMQQEKLFAKEGDTLSGFFGNDVIISSILPETKTPLDNLYFVTAEFKQ